MIVPSAAEAVVSQQNLNANFSRIIAAFWSLPVVLLHTCLASSLAAISEGEQFFVFIWKNDVTKCKVQGFRALKYLDEPFSQTAL